MRPKLILNLEMTTAGLPRWRIIIGRALLFLRIKFTIVVLFCAMMLISVALVGRSPVKEEQNRPFDLDRASIIAERGVSDLGLLGYEPKPRSLGHYFSLETDEIGVQRLDPYLQRRQRQQTVTLPEGETIGQIRLGKSRKYKNALKDPFPEGNCVAQSEWQLTTPSSCNNIHELDFPNLIKGKEDGKNLKFLVYGTYRDVWEMTGYDGEKLALKTLDYDDEVGERNLDRHRRDALVSGQLTSSPSIVDIFSFCGNSAIYEYSSYGDLEDFIFSEGNYTYFSEKDQLISAVQVAVAISDVHTIDDEEKVSVAHADISSGQFVLVNQVYKLTDFNRCRFIGWNEAENKPCGFKVGNNPGKFRSPEEYKYIEESEKIDVYSMGNIFYSILTREYPFERIRTDGAKKMVMDGEHPPVPSVISNSTNTAVRAILNATEMCWAYEPAERPSARFIADYLLDVLKSIENDSGDAKVTDIS